MDKLMNLFDFEFKRNLKYYIIIILFSCTSLFINLIINLKNHNDGINETLQTKTIKEIINRTGSFNFSNLIIGNTMIIIMIGLLICILYSVFIWQREFIFKNKSINSLMMMPQGRGIVYISKLLNVLCLVYVYIISIVVTLFIAYKILPNFMLGNIEDLSFVQSTIYSLSFLPYTFTDFIIEYVFLLLSFITILFAITLSYKAQNNKSSKIIVQIVIIICLPLIMLVPMAIVLFIPLLSNTNIIIISSVVIIGGYILNKKILNKKIDF